MSFREIDLINGTFETLMLEEIIEARGTEGVGAGREGSEGRGGWVFKANRTERHVVWSDS